MKHIRIIEKYLDMSTRKMTMSDVQGELAKEGLIQSKSTPRAGPPPPVTPATVFSYVPGNTGLG